MCIPPPPLPLPPKNNSSFNVTKQKKNPAVYISIKTPNSAITTIVIMVTTIINDNNNSNNNKNNNDSNNAPIHIHPHSKIMRFFQIDK